MKKYAPVVILILLLTQSFCDEEESSIVYSTCPELETTTTLLAKAEYYDELVNQQHLPDGLLRSARLTEDLSDVEYYEMSDNAGFWTSLYIASQAFRYKVTGSSQALENVRTTIKGLYDLSKVTEIPGLWARNYKTPDLPAEALNEERWEYGTGDYDGWRWKNDVSQDEYSGNMFALAVVYELIDDEEIISMVKTLAQEVGDHMIDNGLNILDADGEPTTFGKLYATAGDHYAGFHAMLTLSWIKTAYGITGEQRFENYYRNCLLKMGYDEKCLCCEEDYRVYLENKGFVGFVLYLESCKENYNNFHMTFLAMRDILAFEQDQELIDYYTNYFQTRMWQDDLDFRNAKDQKNPYFTFLFGSQVPYNKLYDQEGFMQAVNDGICTMKLFPETKERREVEAGDYESVCLNRFDEPTAENIIPLNERKLSTECVWKSNPYEIPMEQTGDPRTVYSPGDYLVAYWMGRYYGYIPDNI